MVGQRPNWNLSSGLCMLKRPSVPGLFLRIAVLYFPFNNSLHEPRPIMANLDRGRLVLSSIYAPRGLFLWKQDLTVGASAETPRGLCPFAFLSNCIRNFDSVLPLEQSSLSPIPCSTWVRRLSGCDCQHMCMFIYAQPFLLHSVWASS